MELQWNPYTVPLALAMLLGIVVTVYAFHEADDRMDVWGALTQSSYVLWCLFTLLTVSSVGLAWKEFWFALFMPSILFMILTAFGFTLHFVGRGEWLTRPRIAVLGLLPVAFLLVSLTNGVHGWMLVDVGLDRSGSFTLLTYDWGIGVFAMAAIAYAIVLVYNGLLLQRVLRSRNVYRKMSAVVFFSTALPAVLAFLSLTRLSPFPHFMLVPFSYLLTGVLVLFGTTSVKFVRAIPVDRFLSVFDSRFDSAVPLARDFVVEEIDSGVMVLDSDDRVVDVNSMAKKMLGLDRPIGKHLSDITQPERIVDGETEPRILRDDEELHEADYEIWVETANGTRCYEVRVSRLSGSEGETVAHVVLLHDITKQKRREEQLEQQTEELRAQKQQLEYQNERLDRFAGIVSHDLRNPLNVTDGYLEIMEAKTDEETGVVEVDDDKIAEMRNATSRMENIIEDALTLAREGKALTETEPVDLAEVAEAAWDNVDTGEATLSVDLDLTADGDRGRLLNVFENLYRNAVEHGSTGNQNASRSDDAVEHGSTSNRTSSDDAIEHGREGVSIRVEPLGTGDGFAVADDGPGIPDDRKDSVLESGYTTSDDGTGLGLAIVRDVVRAHGWTIDVADSDAGGARFEIGDVTSGVAVTPTAE
ncbi:histidine kinase N-terminal 7TM domain-containing protein [Halorientalis halophila]|uniref:histidine kinase N-terminal 7TM domain-containing protein n=1 Tax=Halorientalis halophila TaxID=3108499 RepID=UPI00300A7ED4